MKFSKKKLITLYTNLVRARAFDLLFAQSLSEGKLLGFYHQSEGGEAPGVGACSFLRDDDFIWASVRGHGLPHTISKGIVSYGTFIRKFNSFCYFCCDFPINFLYILFS